MFSINELNKSLITACIDSRYESFQHLRPLLVTNDVKNGKKVLEVILAELKTCSTFKLGVAFLTRGGLACLHQTLRELESRDIQGQILVSQYLNFSDPSALDLLRTFSNIELRLISDSAYHGKCYFFDHDEYASLIIGSSNLTQEALGKNAEVNVHISVTKKSELYKESFLEYSRLWNRAKQVTDNVLDEYRKAYDLKKLSDRSVSKIINESDIEINKLEPNLMQKEALKSLNDLRNKNVNKCLIISATGTGKTILSALDAKAFGAKRLLFVVHRLNIAKKAIQEFKSVLGTSRTYGLYSGAERNYSADFIFSTVQTINSDTHLQKFKENEFDYIIIDETHRAGAKTYQRVIDYFQPKFLVGMTATPERTDGFDIFSLFDHNIAFEIRLHHAMESDLLSPFHYYGVSDVSVDGENIDEKSNFQQLTTDSRVKNIFRVLEEYGCDSAKARGLVFCSRNEEAEKLSNIFNENGFKTVHLSGSSSETERESYIQRLESMDESDRIDYIFTVDIFNEGIDIPKVNQVVMLRPTVSAIIFVQQLGRGLRKAEGKEYLTVLDFIGNYQNNYLIPVALFGDSSFSKDKLRKLLSSGSSLIPSESTVNFERIAQKRIFNSIDSANLQMKKALTDDYRLLRYRLGKSPMMMDFYRAESRDPFHYVSYSGSMLAFAMQAESNLRYDGKNLELLKHISQFVNDGKRLADSFLLKQILLSRSSVKIEKYISSYENVTKQKVTSSLIESVINNLNLMFVTERLDGKTVPLGQKYNYSIIKKNNSEIQPSDSLLDLFNDPEIYKHLLDSTEYSIQKFLEDFKTDDFVGGFKRYSKYSRRDVFRILNWTSNPNAQNVGGYIVSPEKSNCPIFVNYHKEDDISDTTKYEDEFIDRTHFVNMSKSKRTLASPDVMSIKEQSSNGIRLPLFIKKNNDEGTEFYYMGELETLEDQFEQTSMSVEGGNSVSVVKMVFKLDKSVESGLYHYITSEIVI